MEKSVNQRLHQAKSARKDEFYTQLNDIQLELKHYKNEFRGKVVFCNCDDPYESNFFKYFALNFNSLGLKKLIATCYAPSTIAGIQLDLFEDVKIKKSDKKAYKIEIEEITDENGDGSIDLSDVEYLLRNNKNVLTQLNGDGDFRSYECVELLKQSDIIVTNPPFSLFREFIDLLEQHNKSFIIMGNTNALSYIEMFKLFQENKIRTGYTNFNVGMFFFVPDSFEKYHKIVDGRKMVRVSTSCWYTNLEVKKHKEEIVLYKQYSEDEYPKYDNYDAINVNKYTDIPYDYNGIIGVPITFLDKYNPNQFELIAQMVTTKISEYNYGYPYINGKKIYARILIRHRQSNINE